MVDQFGGMCFFDRLAGRTANLVSRVWKVESSNPKLAKSYTA